MIKMNKETLYVNFIKEMVNDCLYYRGEDYSYEYISQDVYAEIFSYF